MKKIFFFIIIIIVAAGILMRCQESNDSKNRIIVISSEKVNSSAQLDECSEAISSRLSAYGLDPTLKVNYGSHKIEVGLPDSVEVSDIEGLLTSLGVIEFYETFTRDEVSAMIPVNMLSSFFNRDSGTGDNHIGIGCVTADSLSLVEDLLGSLSIDNCKFIWGSRTYNESIRCLYALKTTGNGGALLNGDDIAGIKAAISPSPSNYDIHLKFKPSAALIWTEMSSRSIGRQVAIVLDNQVLAAPYVQSVISGGDCTISGSFSLKEAKYFSALLSREMPVRMDVVEGN